MVTPVSARVSDDEPQALGATAGPTARDDRKITTARLLTQAAQTADRCERRRLQDEVVVLNMGIARAVAARYRGKGIADEDLTQAAYIALLKAARGFDPTIGRDFLSYAVPTISGEVKRQFRDFGWMVRPPRPIQKLQSEVSAAMSELTQTLGHSPRVTDVAAYLEVPQEDVIEALSADGCFTPTSLDSPCALAIAPERLLLRPQWPAVGRRGRTAAAVALLAAVVAVTGWGLTPALQGESHHHHAAASH